jgi:gliding motility-associated-like protein
MFNQYKTSISYRWILYLSFSIMNKWLAIFFLATYNLVYAQVPTAQFSANKTVVCVGETIHFSDLSVANGSPISVWTYNFGDGNASKAQNPSHAYSQQGTYTVTLVVTAANGQADAEVKIGLITVHPLPVSDFTTATNGCSLPVDVTFSNTSLNGVSFSWDFGTGQTSTAQNPQAVSYNLSGNYPVSLITTSINGCKDTSIQSVNISSFKALINAPLTACVGEPVTITDGSTVGANQWDWSFPGANTVGSGAQNNLISYPLPGSYTISLTSKNTNAGCIDNASLNMNVFPLPVPNFTSDLTKGCAPLPISFKLTGDSGVSYLWDFGNGQTATQANPVFTYSSDGLFTVSLSVSDTNGCTGSIAVPNYITIQAPTGTILADTVSGCAPLPVQLSAAVSSPTDPIVSWEWDFGDGNSFTGENPPVHVYPVGNFDVRLTVTTTSGCSTVLLASEFINTGQIDSLNFTWDLPETCVKTPIQFSNQIIINAPHDPSEVTYSWDFGDGSKSNLPNPLHAYTSDTGYFNVQLIADFRGCRDTITYKDAVHIIAPVSRFTPSQVLFCNPTSFPVTVAVTDFSIIGVLSDDAEMRWKWGDGTQTLMDDSDFDDLNQGSTSHTYSDYGSYTIEHAIYNYTTGCKDSTTATIHISQTIASLQTNVDSVCIGNPVTFTSTSTSTDPFGTFQWKTGDGNTLWGASTPYTYTTSGNFSLKLNTTNTLGCSDSINYSFITALELPLAVISVDNQVGCAPLNVTFSNASISQGNGLPLESFLFQFTDGSPSVTTIDRAASVNHTFNTPGVFYGLLTATDEFGCKSNPVSTSVTITVPTATFTSKNVVCNGETLYASNASSGAAPLSYEWFLDGLSISYSKDYTVTFNEPFNPGLSNIAHQLKLVTTDANGCSDTLTKTIWVSTPQANLTYTLDGAETNANGDFVCPPVFVDFINQSSSFGLINAFNWSFGDGNFSSLTSPSNTYVFPGTYSVSMSITDEFGCTSDTILKDFLTIYGPSANPSYTESLNACGLTVNFTVGATQNVSAVSWNFGDGNSLSGQNTPSHLYNQLGTFSPKLTVHDDNNCQVVYPLGPITLNQPLLSVSVQGDSILCYGNSDGNIAGTIIGGTAPYKATLDQTGTTQNILFDGGSFNFSGLKGAPSGGFQTYTVTIEDAGGQACSVTSNPVTMTEPNAPLSVVLNSKKDIECFEYATGDIAVTASGGTEPYTFSWTGPNSYISNLEDINNLLAGTYVLSISDGGGNLGGCATTITVVLDQPLTGVSIHIDNLVNEACFGQKIGLIETTITGGVAPYNYNWIGPNGFNATSDDLDSLEAGNYILTVSDASGGDCPAILTVSITEPPLLTVSSNVTTNYNGYGISCFGNADGGITTTPFGGTPTYTYSWKADPLTPKASIDPSQSTLQSPGGLTAGNYLLTLTDANGCLITDYALVTEPTPLSLDTLILTIYSNGYNLSGCNHDGVAEALVSGGVSPYSFDWSNDGVGDFNDENPVSSLNAGDLQLTVTDLNGCKVNGNTTLVAQDNVLTLSSTTSVYPSGHNISCYGLANGSIDLIVNGGTIPYSYNWQADPETPSAVVSGTQVAVQDLTNIPAGNYQVTVTEATGCTATLLIQLKEPPKLTQSGSSLSYPSGNNIRCHGEKNGAILNYSVSGGSPIYTYVWSADPSTPLASIPIGQTSLANPNGLSAGTYHVEVTDINTCKIDTFITLTEPTILKQTATILSYPGGDNIRCYGESNGEISSYTISGGSPNYTYLWTSDSLTPAATIPTNQTTSPNPKGLTAGTYHVIATDINSCSIDTTLILTEPTILTQVGSLKNYPSGNQIACHGESNGEIINYTVFGGSPAFTYLWKADPKTPTASIPAGQETNASPKGLSAGSYRVFVTDTNGCNIDTSFTLTEPTELTFTVLIPNFGGYNVSSCIENGFIDLSISGGSPEYAIQWSNGEITEDIESLPAGPISATIIDKNGCKQFLDTVLTGFQPLNITALVTSNYNGRDISCYQADDGVISLFVMGGTPSYSYFWIDSLNNIISTNEIVSQIAPGTYRAIVSDYYDCKDTSLITVTEPPPLTTDIKSITNYNGFDISCYGFADGAIDLVINGGTPVYNQIWTDSLSVTIATIEDPTGLSSGRYHVQVSDLNNCKTDTLITLHQPTAMTSNVIITSNYNGQNISCFQASDGSLSGTITGGVPNYSFIWLDQNGTQVGVSDTLSKLPAGNYTWIVTDINNCTLKQTITLAQPPPVVVTPQIISYYFGAAVSCAYNADGIVKAVASGGVPDYTYAWNTIPAQQGNVATGLAAGNYSVKVTDVNGCTASGTVTLTANPSPQPILPPPVEGCLGSNILVDALPGDWNYCSWTFSDGQQVTNCGPFTMSFDTVGCLAVQLNVLSPEGCLGSAFSQNFACIEPNPIASFYAENYEVSTDLPGENLINTSQGASSYYWYYSDGSNADSTVHAYHEFISNDTSSVNSFQVVLYAISKFGCVDSTMRNFTILPALLVFVPNTFTPDQDLYNNFFFPVLSGAYSDQNYAFMVFNRWGELIFESKNPNDRWDGTYKGHTCQDGVYSWKLKIGHTYSNETVEYVGHVTLLKGGGKE